MLKMRATLAVFGAEGKTIVIDIDFVSSLVYHRLDGNHHTGFQYRAVPPFPEVRDEGVFMHAISHTVTGKLAHDAESVRFDELLNDIPDVSNMFPCSGGRNADPERLFCNMN